jgi:hypothetical protein
MQLPGRVAATPRRRSVDATPSSRKRPSPPSRPPPLLATGRRPRSATGASQPRSKSSSLKRIVPPKQNVRSPYPYPIAPLQLHGLFRRRQAKRAFYSHGFTAAGAVSTLICSSYFAPSSFLSSFCASDRSFTSQQALTISSPSRFGLNESANVWRGCCGWSLPTR